MKSKGFTLIELLAVIVILAIIALIATPIILNIIEDAKEESDERSVEMYAKAIQNSIAKSQLNNNEEVVGTFTTTDGKTLEQEGKTPITVEYDGAKVVCSTIMIYEDGNVYLAGCKIDNGEKDYTYGTQQVSPVCTVIEDNDTSKTITKGDKVSCEFENSTENFYVVSNDGMNVEMLTEFNLDVGKKVTGQNADYSYNIVPIENPTGIQKSEAKGYTYNASGEVFPFYGTIAYISSDANLYWGYYDDDYNFILSVDSNYKTENREYPYIYGNYKENNLYPHVENYVNYLIDNGLTGSTGKLLSYEQVEQLGCSLSSCSSAPQWVNSTSYWLGSSTSDGFPFVISYNNYINSRDYLVDGEFGVRPLITVSESLINKNI